MRSSKQKHPTKEYAIPLPHGFPHAMVRVRLSIPDISGFRQLVQFAEHVLLTDRSGCSRTVVATSVGSFFRSEDLGATWHRFDVTGFDDERFVHSFSLPDGSMLLQCGDIFPAGTAASARQTAGMVVTLSPAGHVVASFRPSEIDPGGVGAKWHGTSSIDCAGGVVMYAEYSNNPGGVSPDGSPRRASRVLRSRDLGRTWEVVFEKGGEEVRHFHMLRADPGFPGTWWLASGDVAQECRIWRSSDDGDTWEDVTAGYGEDVPVDGSRFGRAVFRLTDVAFIGRDGLLWGTDDVLGLIDPDVPLSSRGGSRVFEAAREGEFKLSEVGYCGQAVRSIVDCGSYLILITQGVNLRHTTRASVFVFFKGTNLGCFRLFDVDNFDGATTSFTASRSSRFARDGTFCTYRGPADVFEDERRILKWEVEIS